MKTLKFTFFILIFFTLGSSCSKDSSVDPLAQWLGNWNGTYTFNNVSFDNNCVTINNPVSDKFTTVIITKSANSDNTIELNWTGFKTTAIVSGTTGIATNVTPITFDTNLILANGKLTFTYRNGNKNTCTIFGTSRIVSAPHIYNVELTK